MSKEISNPPRTQFALTMVVATLAIGIFFIAIDPSILMITVMSFAMALILFTAWYAEYDRRPTKIVIEKNGIRIHLRRRRTRFVEWAEISVIGISQMGRNPFSGRMDKGGRLVTAKGWWPITAEASQALVNAYTEAVGEPPHIDWRDRKR